MPNVVPISLSVEFNFGEQSQLVLARHLNRLSEDEIGDWVERTIVKALEELGYKPKSQ